MTPDTPHETDKLTSPDPGPDSPDPRRRRRRGLVGGLLTLALLAAGATGVALAADGRGSGPAGTSADASAKPDGAASKAPGDRKDRHPRRPGRGGARLGARGPGGPGGALHGELVVPKQGGGYQTILVQRGTVTAVSSSSITVKSEDGFTQAFAVTADTLVNAARDGISSIDTGADVAVLARKAGGGPTALRVFDRSRWGGLRGGPGDRHHEGGGRPGPRPSSTATSSSSLGT